VHFLFIKKLVFESTTLSRNKKKMSANLSTLHLCKGQERQVVYTFISPLNHIDDLKLNESSEISDKTCFSFNFFTIG